MGFRVWVLGFRVYRVYLDIILAQQSARNPTLVPPGLRRPKCHPWVDLKVRPSLPLEADCLPDIHPS